MATTGPTSVKPSRRYQILAIGRCIDVFPFLRGDGDRVSWKGVCITVKFIALKWAYHDAAGGSGSDGFIVYEPDLVIAKGNTRRFTAKLFILRLAVSPTLDCFSKQVFCLVRIVALIP